MISVSEIYKKLKMKQQITKQEADRLKDAIQSQHPQMVDKTSDALKTVDIDFYGLN